MMDDQDEPEGANDPDAGSEDTEEVRSMTSRQKGMNAAIDAGGREERFKDLGRQAAQFRGDPEADSYAERFKSGRREAAASRQAAFRSAGYRR